MGYDYLLDKDILIFDFDGCLYDSEPIHYQAHKYLLEKYQLFSDFTVELYLSEYIGRTTEEIIKYAINKNYEMGAINERRYKALINVDNVSDMVVEKTEKFKELLLTSTDLPINEKLEDIIVNYSEDKILYILSAEQKDIIVKTLIRWGYIDYFSNIISISETNTNKLFELEKIKRMYKDSKLVYFEDSPIHIESAKSLGICTVGLEYPMNYGRVTNANYKIVM